MTKMAKIDDENPWMLVAFFLYFIQYFAYNLQITAWNISFFMFLYTVYYGSFCILYLSSKTNSQIEKHCLVNVENNFWFFFTIPLFLNDQTNIG